MKAREVVVEPITMVQMGMLGSVEDLVVEVPLMLLQVVLQLNQEQEELLPSF
jgi:hypothetical protein